jgi:hypothetical protein
MKKIILFAALAFTTLIQAQVITATADGETITEGQTFITNGLNAQAATLDLVVTNVSNSDIFIKLRVNTITNADGNDVQFCFGGLCYFSIAEGNTVPTNDVLVAIEPGGTNADGDHFLNENPGTNPAADVNYNLSFIQVSSTGEVLGTLLTFNYKYSPAASASDFSALQNMGITLSSTVVKNQLDVTANTAATLELYNINGQIVKKATIAQGTQTVDISSLSSAVYFAKFTTQNNKTSQIKVVKN